jgi:DNA primase
MAPQFIRGYLLEKFKDNYKLSSNNVELIVPTLFINNDWKRHLSINLDTGLWQCFKTGKKGNFIQLYAFLEDISYREAEADILFKELNEEFEPYSPPPRKREEVSSNVSDLNLLPITLDDYDTEDVVIQKAWTFLYSRNLFNLKTGENRYYISQHPKYKDRLIIPFEENNNIFYFQARSLRGDTPKYLNPSDGWAKPSHILYPFDEEEDHLVICEGPLDAISLQIQGINATCTLGCSVSECQVEILKEFRGKIIIGYDNDDAGKRGVNKFDYLRKLKRMADLYICHPPSKAKDWNEAHIQGSDLKRFVDMRTKKYDYDYLIDHLLTTL